jgi:hypothetical protein
MAVSYRQREGPYFPMIQPAIMPKNTPNMIAVHTGYAGCA